MSNETIKELTDLVRESGKNPSEQKIEMLVPEETLPKYEPIDLFYAAYEMGCIISKCCMNDGFYKVNGTWLKPPEELLIKLEKYEHISHTYCDPCFKKEMQELDDYQAEREKQKSQ